MSTSMLTRAFILIPLLAAIGCSSSRVGGRHLYDMDADPPRLHDGEVRLETYRRIRGKRIPDIRVLRCRDGVVTGLVESRRAKERGEATLSVKVWAQVWDDLLYPGAFEYTAEEPKPDGSYYHLVSIRLDSRVKQFSAQRVPSLFGAVVKQRRERVEVVNAIVGILEREVPVSPWTPPSEEEAAEPMETTEPTP